jgi:hypothetical protein
MDAGEDGVVVDALVTETLAWSTERRQGLQLQKQNELVAMASTDGSEGNDR